MCSDMGHSTPPIISIELQDTVKNSDRAVFSAVADLKLLVGAARCWLSSGTVGMLWDLLQLLFAGLEEAHGWLARDWEKRPGLHNRSEGTVTRLFSGFSSLKHRLRMMHSKTLNEGRRVGHRHRAIIWYREQLIRCHGDSVLVDTLKMGVARQAQEVQLSVCQMFPEHYGEGADENLILYIQYTHTRTVLGVEK